MAGVVLFLALMAVGPWPPAPLSAQTQGSVAFENVTVIPVGTDGTLPDQTVVVTDGLIAAIGPTGSVTVPSDAFRIDGRGKYLTPGLAEMDARLPAEDDPLRVVVLEEMLLLYLANGVTTIQAVNGSPYQIALKDQIIDGTIVSPNLYAGAPALSAASVADAAAAETRAHEQLRAGYDFLTAAPDLSVAARDAAAAVARELEVALVATSAPMGWESVLQSGMTATSGLNGLLEATRRDDVGPGATAAQRFQATDPQKLAALAEATAASGMYLIPGQYLANHQQGWSHVLGGFADADSVRALPEFRYVPQTILDEWATEAWNVWDAENINPESARAFAEWRRELLSALHAAGATILMGSRSPALFNVAGFSLHRELPLLVEAGMTPTEVLRSGTVEAGRYARDHLGSEEEFGTVSVGGRADLLLLDSDPLASVAALASPAGVMVRGRWLAREELATRLAQIARRHAPYDAD